MRSPLQVLVALALVAVPVMTSSAQRIGPKTWARYEVDGPEENYIRSLQALGEVPLHPWSLRGFSPVELTRLLPRGSGDSWVARLVDDTIAAPRAGGALAPARLRMRYNSSFPFGGNDGAVWAGRGLTVAATVGAAARLGPLTVSLQPVAFWAQNQSVPMMETGRTGVERYADGLYNGAIDRPQRFGDDPYARVDAGRSTVRLDAFGVATGVSTENLWWGPAQEFPFLLGTNAAGLPHAFVGTSAPAPIWIGRLHAKLVWGRADQSGYFVPTGPTMRDRRFVTGLIVAFTPRGFEQLEIGGARFFHAPWPDEGLPGRYLTRTFEGLFKTSLPEVDDPIDSDSRSIDGENQIASVFARLVLPGTGFEVYGEIGREDHPWDLRHLILSPDEQSSMTVGARRSWRAGDRGVRVVRGEIISYRQRQVDRRRLGPAVYIHASGANQGHTQRGQLLGADLGVGSAGGSILGYDHYSASGRTTFEWRRAIRQEYAVLGPDGTGNPKAVDVLHTLTASRTRRRGALEIDAALDVSYNFNRDFGGDQQNVGLRIGLTGLP